MSRLVSLFALAAAVSGCARSSFSRDDAARICSTLQLCSPGDFYLFGGDLPRCTTEKSFLPRPGSLETSPAIEDGMEEPLRDVFTCLLGARGDCEKAARCWARVGEPSECTPTMGAWSSSLLSATCEGSVVSGCAATGKRFAIDCAKYGEVCGVRYTNFADLGVGTCGLAACPPAGTALGCRGSSLEVCQGELLALADCAALGLRCEAPTDGGSASCVGGASCDVATDSAKCEGSVLVRCTAEGQRVRVDCALSPRNKQCRAGQCAPTGNECTPQSECRGAALAYCQDGFIHVFDCVAEGFGACDSGRCTPR